MKNLKLTLLTIAIVASSALTAQLKTPQPSPVGEVSQVVGLTDVEVEYSRPGMKGRTIFGELVAYDKIWRLGANASTKLKTSDDITLGGLAVPAGEYALYAIPGDSEWTIVVHKDLTLWGDGGYDEKNDLGRVKAKVNKTNDTYETLTIDFSNLTTEGADLVIRWENTSVSIPITTTALAQVEAQIKKEIIDGPGPGEYASAARFYLDQEKDMNLALEWIDKAIKGRPEAFWYMHNKAQILSKLGRTKEAITVAEKSLAMAKANEEGDYGYAKNNEELIKELKALPPTKGGKK